MNATSPNAMSSQATKRPQSLSDLYLTFTWLALQGFGGALAVAQRELVERKQWMTNAEFAEEWAVAQILPGPNVVNLSVLVGGGHFGWRGALASIAGMLSIPLVLLLLIAIVCAQFAHHPGFIGALRGMSAISSGLIAGTGLKFIDTFKAHPMGVIPCLLFGIASFVLVGTVACTAGLCCAGLGCIRLRSHLSQARGVMRS